MLVISLNIEFFNHLKNREIGGVLELIDRMEKEGKNLAVFAKDVSKHARNLLVIKTCENANEILNLPEDVFALFKEQADAFNEKDLKVKGEFDEIYPLEIIGA